MCEVINVEKSPKICGVCQSTFWYSASVVVFVLIAVASALAEGPSERLEKNRGITTHVSETAEKNPAPSITLHYVGAKWCGPCQRLKPILRELEEDGYRVKFYDIDKDPEAPKPTQGAIPYMRWDRFDKVVSHDTGLLTKKQLIEKFDKLEGKIFWPTRS